MRKSCYEVKIMGVKIYADAGSNLFPEVLKAKDLDIKVVSMKLYIRNQEYNCYDENFNTKEVSKLFYEELSGNNNIRTSLINPNDYLEAFKDDISKGHQIICVTMAKGISGTYQSACIARDMINEEFGREMVYVLDSATAGFGEGIQAIKLAKEAQYGKDFASLIKEAEEFKYKVRSEFTVDDINFLARTGRVNKVVAKIANALKIKVLLKGSNESTIVSTAKVPGRKLSLKKLAKQCIDYIRKPEKQTVYITHCNCLDDANKMKDELMKNGINNVEIYDYDLVTGSHLGPNALAIFYVGDNREFDKGLSLSLNNEKVKQNKLAK